MASPIRVLHIVNDMDCGGGIETWLMHLLRRMDIKDVTFDFLVETGRPSRFVSEIQQRGGRVIACGRPKEVWSYAKRFAGVLRELGPFHVVHSHVHILSGLTLWVAGQWGVPQRLAHGHTDRRVVDHTVNPLKRWSRAALRMSLRSCMTRGFAVSDGAALDLFGANYRADSRISVLPCAIDYSKFASTESRQAVRDELGIPTDAHVIGHVGRFESSKNHAHLIDAFSVAAKMDNKLHLLCVGEGSARSAMSGRVSNLN